LQELLAASYLAPVKTESRLFTAARQNHNPTLFAEDAARPEPQPKNLTADSAERDWWNR